MQIAAEDPFGQEVPVLVPHQDLDATPRVTVLFGKFDGGTQRLPLAGIGGGIASPNPHDGPFGLAPHDHISKLIHGRLPRLPTRAPSENVCTARLVPAVLPDPTAGRRFEEIETGGTPASPAGCRSPRRGVDGTSWTEHALGFRMLQPSPNGRGTA
jgi:hypothetical protein